MKKFRNYVLQDEDTGSGDGGAGATTAPAPTNNSSEINDLKSENQRMKAKLDELLDEAKRAKEAKRQIEEESKKATEERAKKENDFEQLYKSAMERNEVLEGKLKSIEQKSVTDRLNAEASKLAAGLTKDSTKAEILADKIKSRLSYDGEGFKVLDDSGALTVSPVEELVNSVKERYAFLVDANGSTGGGATGANSGAVKTSSKKFNEYTGGELSEIRRSDPQRYAQLKSEFNGA